MTRIVENPEYSQFTNLETYSIASLLEGCEEIQDVIADCRTYAEVVEKLEDLGYDGNEFGVKLNNGNLNIMQLDRVVRDITGL